MSIKNFITKKTVFHFFFSIVLGYSIYNTLRDANVSGYAGCYHVRFEICKQDLYFDENNDMQN